jgi:hypothetical protein
VTFFPVVRQASHSLARAGRWCCSGQGIRRCQFATRRNMQSGIDCARTDGSDPKGHASSASGAQSAQRRSRVK